MTTPGTELRSLIDAATARLRRHLDDDDFDGAEAALAALATQPRTATIRLTAPPSEPRAASDWLS